MDRLNVKEFKTRWLRGYANPELRKLPVKSNVQPLVLEQFKVEFLLYTIDFTTLKSVEDKTQTISCAEFSYCIEDETGKVVFIYNHLSKSGNKIFNYYDENKTQRLPIGKRYYLRIIGCQGIIINDTKIKFEHYHLNSSTVFRAYGHIGLLKEINGSQKMESYFAYGKQIWKDNSNQYMEYYTTELDGICGSEKIVIKSQDTNEDILIFSNKKCCYNAAVAPDKYAGFLLQPLMLGYGIPRSTTQTAIGVVSDAFYGKGGTFSGTSTSNIYDNLLTSDYGILQEFISEILKSTEDTYLNIDLFQKNNSLEYNYRWGSYVYITSTAYSEVASNGNFVSKPIWADLQYYREHQDEKNKIVSLIATNFNINNQKNNFFYDSSKYIEGKDFILLKNNVGFCRLNLDISIQEVNTYYFSGLLVQSDDYDELVSKCG